MGMFVLCDNENKDLIRSQNSNINRNAMFVFPDGVATDLICFVFIWYSLLYFKKFIYCTNNPIIALTGIKKK